MAARSPFSDARARNIAALRLKWLLTTEGRRASEREGEKAANHTEQPLQMHAQLFRLHERSLEAQRRRKTILRCHVRRRGHHDSGRDAISRSRGHDNSRIPPIEGV